MTSAPNLPGFASPTSADGRVYIYSSARIDGSGAVDLDASTGLNMDGGDGLFMSGSRGGRLVGIVRANAEVYGTAITIDTNQSASLREQPVSES